MSGLNLAQLEDVAHFQANYLMNTGFLSHEASCCAVTLFAKDTGIWPYTHQFGHTPTSTMHQSFFWGGGGGGGK